MKIDIIYSNPGGVYLSGQIVDGHVKLYVLEPTKLEAIHVRCCGNAVVSWSEGSGDDSTTYSNKETYFYTKMALLEKKPDQRKLTLLRGVYMYPFSFQLPFDIPNSYQGNAGFVRYEVTVTVVRHWAFNKSKTFPFTVISHLDLNTLPFVNIQGVAEDEKIVRRFFSIAGRVRAAITTDRLGYVPGEDITFTAQIHNNSDTDMGPCQAALSMKVFYESTISRTTSSYILCKQFGPAVPSGRSCLWERQKLHIPPLPPSFLHRCRLIDIEYYVSISVTPVGHGSALFVPLRIVIGTIPLQTATHVIPCKEKVFYVFYEFNANPVQFQSASSL
ncbi:hypothetical protein ACJMK2_043714 [Sinanodonta woodiana]|uniref:Arrestin C-terminal-like domain-containing protein n=1 Tax=Sinanodonta woodiana TaxID=1069815 RepID=A0ABD3W0Y8_SINWO